MSKQLTPLEALERIKREAGTPYFSTLYDIDMWKEDFSIIKTALKRLEQIEINQTIFENNPITVGKKIRALEIIKKIVKHDIEVNGNIDIPKYESNEVITQEEFDLLKEVLL